MGLKAGEKRYIVNHGRSQVIHDRKGLTERCNTDQLAFRQDHDRDGMELMLRHGYRFCRWCHRESD